MTGTSSSPSPKPCPVSEAAASPTSLAEDCCSSWPGKEAQDISYAGRSAAAPLQRGTNTTPLPHIFCFFPLSPLSGAAADGPSVQNRLTALCLAPHSAEARGWRLAVTDVQKDKVNVIGSTKKIHLKLCSIWGSTVPAV